MAVGQRSLVNMDNDVRPPHFGLPLTCFERRPQDVVLVNAQLGHGYASTYFNRVALESQRGGRRRDILQSAKRRRAATRVCRTGSSVFDDERF